ncbi:uncharacterized protein LOC100905865 [Galendromus occidentalis]|uniref:Uncharacterized protein LOC100905865 n=1 Tax=Galendromus occidentalis TaxID=34638 RepID=A0AAJ6QS32_9ACAR|nr:uncharacterized protein LOC100905865 [Galendromus occidentalis]
MSSNSKRTRNFGVPLNSLKCSIETCKTKPMNGKHIYPIPRGPTRCLWIDMIRRHNRDPDLALTYYICSDHFSDDQKLPNGHLKGNSVPNIFPSSLTNTKSSPIECQFCDEIFKSRRELLAHDSEKHLEQYSAMKIELQGAAPEARRETPQCKKCRKFARINTSLQKTRRGIKDALQTLEALREDLREPIRLEVNVPSAISS